MASSNDGVREVWDLMLEDFPADLSISREMFGRFRDASDENGVLLLRDQVQALTRAVIARRGAPSAPVARPGSPG